VWNVDQQQRYQYVQIVKTYNALYNDSSRSEGIFCPESPSQERAIEIAIGDIQSRNPDAAMERNANLGSGL